MKHFKVILFLLISFFSFGQTKDTYKDSIIEAIAKLPSDGDKGEHYYDAATYALRRLNQPELCRMFIDSTQFYAKRSKKDTLNAQCYFMYGLLERLEGNYDKALEYLDKNISFFKTDSINKAYALFQVASIYRKQGDYEKSLLNYIEIQTIFEHKKDTNALAYAYNSIANIYGDMEEPDQALENYQNALTLFEALGRKQSQALTLSNMAEIYLRKGDTLVSRATNRRALILSEELDDAFGSASSCYNIGRTYLGDGSNVALSYFQKAEPIFEMLNRRSKLLDLYNDMAKHYQLQGAVNNSLKYYNKALQLLDELQYPLQAKNTYQGLSDNYKKLKRFEEAYNYQVKYVTVKDALFNEENLKTINTLEKQFETAEKNKAIVEQELEIEQQKLDLQKKQSQNRIMLGLTVFLLLSTLLLVLWYRQYTKRKNQEIKSIKQEQKLKTLASLIEGEEKERIRIARELHDSVNADLSSVKFKLNTILEQNNKVINEAVNMIDKSCEQVRAISHNLVPPSIKNFSLLEALRDFCETKNSLHDQEVSFSVIGNPIPLTKNQELNIYRIVQELVANSLKHAQAKTIMVQLAFNNNTLHISVEDDGVGFKNDVNFKSGIGLENVKARIDYLNGELDLTTDDKGTSFEINIDLS